MKTLLAIILAATCGAASAVELMLPADGATVPLLSDGQKAFFDSSDGERLAKAGDAVYRADLLALGWYPQPVVFVWSGINSRISPSSETIILSRGIPITFSAISALC